MAQPNQNINMLYYLVQQAKEFRADNDYYQRNRHMHAITECPDQAVIDAVLVGFINTVAMNKCIDFGLYTHDLDDVTEIAR